MRALCCVVLAAACAKVERPPAAPAPASIAQPVIGKVAEGGELIGTPAPPLDVAWVDGAAHPLAEDRGKVVLVRWWTDTCPLCVHSSGAFSSLAREFGDDLVIRAVYHNKVRGRAVDAGQVQRFAQDVGYPWLVGHDEKWGALRTWWLDAGPRSFTSVTFLLDKAGKIRAIHTGGEFHADGECLYDDSTACRSEFNGMRAAVRALIAES